MQKLLTAAIAVLSLAGAGAVTVVPTPAAAAYRGGFRGPPRPGGPWRPPFDDRRPPPRFPDGPPSDSSPMRQDDRDD